jgi:hypothetical protein
MSVAIPVLFSDEQEGVNHFVLEMANQFDVWSRQPGFTNNVSIRSFRGRKDSNGRLRPIEHMPLLL